jgi:tetratricopeptide (TPR) repeat protein
LKPEPARLASLRSYAAALTLALCAFLNSTPEAFAQGGGAQPPRAQQPARQPGGQDASGLADDATRERRAQAYVKLLEGQRIFTAARTGNVTVDTLRRAQQSFQQAADLDPTLSEAHTALAEIAFFFFNDMAQAEREAKTATRISPNNLGAHRVLSRIYALRSNLSDGQPDRASSDSAVAALREVVRLHPTDAEAWALLAEFHLEAGRTDEAVEALRRWAGAPPALDVRFYQIATKGRELTADAAHARLAETLLGAGKVEEAFAAARQALAIEPDNNFHLELLERASARLAEKYAADRRTADAVSLYEGLLRAQGVTDRPVSDQRERQLAARALSAIVILHRQARDFDKAAAAVQRLRAVLGADDPVADLHSIDLLRDQGKKGEAVELARAASRRHPNDARLFFRESVLLAETGRAAEAAALFRTRLKGTPEDYDTYVTYASAMLQAGRGRDAVEAAQKALDLAPKDRQDLAVQALLLLSSAQDRAGDFKGSEQSLRQVLAREPGNATALNNLGYFLAERNERLAEALEMVKRAVEAEPANPSFLDSLGWVYFKLGKLDEAERYLSEAARLNPDSAAAQEHLGDLLHKQGKSDQALTAWRKALSLSTENEDTGRIRAKIDGGTK